LKEEFAFTTSDEVFSWLSRFINLEQGQKPKSFRLDRMETLCKLAGSPEKCAPSVHIAGSKGKGSVTSMLAAMLTAAGYRVARYMSPHVINIRERICLGNEFFDEDVYVSAGNELRRITEELLPALKDSQPSAASLFDPSTDEGCEPTFWELLTLLFFLCARCAKCDVIAAETGMGGRLDSTNVLDPVVSVITLIELEHTSILGSTIEAIAGEKAGIIKPGKPLILAKQCGEALKVFEQKSQEKNSPLIYFPDIAELSNIKVTEQGTEFSLLNLDSSLFPCRCASSESLGGNPNELHLSIPLPGKVQAENAALAITALKTAFPKIGEKAIRGGLANLKIPARFEKIAEEAPTAHQKTFIIDGAHTPESLALCIETFCSLYGEGGVLIFGCAADKDAAAMAGIAHSRFAKIIITTPGTFKTSSPEHVYEIFAKIAGTEKTLLVKDTREAVRQARLFAEGCQNNSRGDAESQRKEDDAALPILGTGSFYLVSEIRKCMVKNG